VLHAFVLPVSFKESTDGLMLGLVLDTIEARACRCAVPGLPLAWLRQNVDAFNRLFGQRGELHRRRRFARTRERMLVSGNCMGFLSKRHERAQLDWKLVTVAAGPQAWKLDRLKIARFHRDFPVSRPQYMGSWKLVSLDVVRTTDCRLRST